MGRLKLNLLRISWSTSRTQQSKNQAKPSRMYQQSIIVLALALCVGANMTFEQFEQLANEMRQREQDQMNRREGSMCGMCKMGLKTAIPIISTAAEGKLFPMLKEKCEKIGGEAEKNLRLSFAGEEGEKLLEVILSVFDKDNFCELIRLC